MTVSKLASLIAAKEGKKKSINIAQISEVVGIMADLCFKSPAVILCLLAHGKRRKERK